MQTNSKAQAADQETELQVQKDTATTTLVMLIQRKESLHQELTISSISKTKLVQTKLFKKGNK